MRQAANGTSDCFAPQDEALEPAEAKSLLSTLLAARPELLAEVAELADAQLGATTADAVREDAALALEGLGVEDIWERSGRQPDGSYVEPSEAAWEVVEETVASFLVDLGRRVALGRPAEATALCEGLLLGLYEAMQDGEGEFIDGYAEGTLEEAAGRAIEAWTGGAGGTRSRVGARELAGMRGFVAGRLPEWESFLMRSIEPVGRRGTR